MGKNTKDMTVGSLMPKIIAFSIPLALTGLLQLVYNAADMIVVGRFSGSNSLAAVGATSMLVNITVAMFIGLSTGSGVVVAQNIGAQDAVKVHRSVHSAILLGLVSGVIVMVFGWSFSSAYITITNTPENIVELSKLYIKIYFIGAPASMLYNFGAAVLRAAGNSKTPFYALSVSGLVNILLNVILVVVFKLDVAGVAIATVISQVLSAIWVLVSLCNRTDFIRLSILNLRFYSTELTEILKIGIPAGIQGSLFSISNVLIQSSINSFGSQAIAGNTASASIDNIIYVMCNAISQAAMTFTSQNYGAKKMDRVNRTFKDCFLLIMGVNFFLCGVFYLFRVRLLGIFTTDSEVINFGCIRLSIFTAGYFLNTIIDVITAQMRGLGKSFTPMIITLAGVVGFRFIWIFTVFRKMHDLSILYYSYPISWIITMIGLITCYIVVYRKMIKPFKNRTGEVM